MRKLLTYRGGQRLSYAEYADPGSGGGMTAGGHAVLVQHGMIASIHDGALFSRLIEAGVRVLCMARPGYGDSTAYRMRDLAEWGEIVAVLVEQLGLARFDVLGLSSGAPYSYAIGHTLPDKVRTIYVLSGTPALYDERVQSLWPYPIDLSASLAELQALAGELFFSDLSEDDRLRNDIRDSTRNDCFGIAQDLLLRCRDWGFALSEVKPRVVIQHSRADTQVPLATAERTAALLPNCRFEVRETGGHFSGQILDEFLDLILADRRALLTTGGN